MNKEIIAKNLLIKIKKVVKKKYLNLHAPDISENDIFNVNKSLRTSYVSTFGPYRTIFENKLKKITKAKYIVAVNTGTSALFLSLKALNLPKNSEILIPSLTFVATANVVIYNNLVPHFVDAEKENFGIDFDKLDSYLEKNILVKGKKIFNKNTKKQISAIIPVHLFGHSVNCSKLIKLSKKYNLKVIEDATEALGSTFKKKHLGLFGDVGCLSFNGNKIITTGAGGAIITNNYKLYKKCFHLANIAKIPSKNDLEHDSIGYNVLMPNLNASLGISQIDRLNKFVSNKRKLFKKYNAIFKNDSSFTIYEDQKFEKSNFWLQTLILNKHLKKYKNFLIYFLKKNKIGCRPVWKCLHLLKPYKNFPKMPLNNSINHYKSVINLPSSYNIF